MVPTSEEFPFAAPLENYKKFDEWAVGKENWSEAIDKQYYLRLRNGDFGRRIATARFISGTKTLDSKT